MSTEPEPALHRCRRGARCADRVRLVNEDGSHAGWDGILLDGPGLCPVCVRKVKYDIQDLPGDVRELSELLVPSGEQRYRDPDMPAQPRQKLVTPVPLDLSALTLQELIDTETTIWATAVARACGLDTSGAWSTLRAARSRQLARVETACALLAHRLDWFLALPVTETPARSLTTRRGDGHDPDTTTVYGDEWWAHRDGITAALLLSDLHRIAESKAARRPADQLPLPCPTCRRPALIRLHYSGKVECKACGDRMTDQEYDGHFFTLGRLHRIEEPIVPPARKPAPEKLTGIRAVRPRATPGEALPVTKDNLEEVADWCGGTVDKAWVGSTRRVTATVGYCSHFVTYVDPRGHSHDVFPGHVLVKTGEGTFEKVTAEDYAALYEEIA